MSPHRTPPAAAEPLDEDRRADRVLGAMPGLRARLVGASAVRC